MQEIRTKKFSREVVFESSEKIKIDIELVNIDKGGKAKDFLETMFKEILGVILGH